MKNLTVADIEKMEKDDRWFGFGYIGARVRTDRQDLVPAADAKVLEAANALGWDFDALMVWADSKSGRWYGDCMFGAHGSHADRYLPGQMVV